MYPVRTHEFSYWRFECRANLSVSVYIHTIPCSLFHYMKGCFCSKPCLLSFLVCTFVPDLVNVTVCEVRALIRASYKKQRSFVEGNCVRGPVTHLNNCVFFFSFFLLFVFFTVVCGRMLMRLCVFLF